MFYSPSIYSILIYLRVFFRGYIYTYSVLVEWQTVYFSNNYAISKEVLKFGVNTLI